MRGFFILAALLSLTSPALYAEAAKPPEAVVVSLSPEEAGKAYVTARALELDWPKLVSGGERAVLVGDSHEIRAIKPELAAHMGDFRAAGITHIGFEMFGDDHQDALARYCAEGDAQGAVHSDLSYWLQATDEVEDLLKAACKAGLQPVALDYPYSQMSHRDRHTNEGLDLRDRRMAANVMKALAGNSSSRILVFAGGLHVLPKRMPRLLGEQDVSSLTLQFLADRDDAFRGYKSLDIVAGAKAAGLDGRRLMVRDRDAAAQSRFGDWFLLVPEVVREAMPRPEIQERGGFRR